jgi:hypothetical protein
MLINEVLEDSRDFKSFDWDGNKEKNDKNSLILLSSNGKISGGLRGTFLAFFKEKLPVVF